MKSTRYVLELCAHPKEGALADHAADKVLGRHDVVDAAGVLLSEVGWPPSAGSIRQCQAVAFRILSGFLSCASW
eukprot:4707577-Pyramimonas_sp.AAC.1